MYAEIRVENVTIPTYGTGAPDKNPMFLEKRVYQGSSGKVYPFPVIDAILDEKVDKTYTAVWLENEYIRVMVLPQLGGRIQRAQDKTNGYDFVYYNEVIKPMLVGLTGPWVSGGIEFNWPQHHRPTTFAPVDWHIVENDDGSKSVELSEVDQMYGTKGMMRISIYPDKAYIEVKGQLYNRTNLPQTFLWWANPAVAVNDDTQSIFPPDVCAVYDHGKRDVSHFPIATGVYYKHDYGAGVDISRYKNIPVPTSYMCAHSDYNFLGGYDYGKKAGVLHVADHHISPGKKQWTWGCGDFGKAWDRNLTDRNGPYVELMTGVYCDNQPDFTWLAPFEEKTFTQYFMPYKEAGCVKNASQQAAVNLEVENGEASIVVYATALYRDMRVVLCQNGKVIFERVATLSPRDVLKARVKASADETALELAVYTADGCEVLRYAPQKKKIEKIPDPMPAAKLPKDIQTVEELYLTGVHIEQYRHATYLSDPYYIEALSRDPYDIRTNNAYGMLLLRRGQFSQGEACFRKAIERMVGHNPNPYDSEAFFNLGLALFYQKKMDDAYEAFYKGTWSAAQQEGCFYYLSAIDCRKGDFLSALEHVEHCIVRNGHNLKARVLKGLILDRLGCDEQARICWQENLALDAFSYVSHIELGDTDAALTMMQDRMSSFIECAIDYAEAGFYQKAVDVLCLCTTAHPMKEYYTALYASFYDEAMSMTALRAAEECDSAYCFPNKLEDIAALQYAIAHHDEDSKAYYYLGCLYYDRRRYEEAIRCWTQSAERNALFPTVWRNLSLAYFNKRNDAKRAFEYMQRAYMLDQNDARVLLEYDQLCHILNIDVDKRIAFLDEHWETVCHRDDLYIAYCTLLNLQEKYAEALEKMKARRFHPWEGGEGKVTRQYAIALTQLARLALNDGDAATAKLLLMQALVFPENLGEGKLTGARDNDIYYYLGQAERALGNEDAAVEALRCAAKGDEEPASAVYYNDQPADLILYEGLAAMALGDTKRAKTRFHKLVSYGEKHYYDHVTVDYFAVSMPDLQLFEADLDQRNRTHCEYLIALGSFGLGDIERAKECYRAVLSVDCAHQGAIMHRALV